MNNYHKFKTCPRLYVDGPLGQGETLSLNEAQAHYLRAVLRMSVGGSIRLFNGRDGEWLAKIAEMGKKKCVARLEMQLRDQPEGGHNNRLVFAPLKKTQTDLVIEKATELGVEEIYPVITEYSQTRKIRLDRLQNIAVEAAEQCERLTLPHIADIVPLEACLDRLSGPFFVALERAGEIPQSDDMRCMDYTVVVGPEGGFSEVERDVFLSDRYDVKVLNLGENILRAETAVISALSILNYCGSA